MPVSATAVTALAEAASVSAAGQRPRGKPHLVCTWSRAAFSTLFRRSCPRPRFAIRDWRARQIPVSKPIVVVRWVSKKCMVVVLFSVAAINVSFAAEASLCFDPSLLDDCGLNVPASFLMLQHGNTREKRAREHCVFARPVTTCATRELHVCTQRIQEDQNVCPSECGVVSRDPYFPCFASCGTQHDCFRLAGPDFGFWDKVSNSCEKSRLVGCRTYANTTLASLKFVGTAYREARQRKPRNEECLECADGFTLRDGACRFNGTSAPAIIGIILMVLAGIIFVAVGLVNVKRMLLPQGDAEVLSAGWIHRTRCFVSLHSFDDPSQPAEPVPFHFKNPAANNALGAGHALFYVTLLFVSGFIPLMKILVAILLGFVFFNGKQRIQLLSSGICKFQTTEDVDEAVKGVLASRLEHFVELLVLWLVLFISSLVKAFYQKYFFHRLSNVKPTLAECVLKIEGVPPEADDGDILDFINFVETQSPVSVSVAYDFSNREDAKHVEDLLSRHIDEMVILNKTSNIASELPKIRHARSQWQTPDGRNAEGFLSELQGSGVAFVICSSEEDRNMFEAEFEKEAPQWDNYSPTLSRVTGEPQTFFWGNVGAESSMSPKRLLCQVVLFLAVSAGLFFALFLPFHCLLHSQEKIPSRSWFLLYGALIALQLPILFAFFERIAHEIDFHWKGSESVFLFAGYVTAGCTYIYFHIHYILVVFMDGTAGRGPEADTSARIIWEAMQEDILSRTFLYSFIIGFVLVRFIVRPLFLVIKVRLLYWCSLPLWPLFSHRDLRSDPTLTPRQAALALEPEPMKLHVDYADFVICHFLSMLRYCVGDRTEVTAIMEAPLTIEVSFILVVVVAFNLWIYFGYQVWHLRFCKLVDYTTPTLDEACNYALAIPISVVVAAAARSAVASGDFAAHFEKVIWLVALLVHCAALYAISYVEPCCRAELPHTKPSQEKAKKLLRYDFFNTNPVHVLKSRHCHTDRPLVYFTRGRENLQRLKGKEDEDRKGASRKSRRRSIM
eukprot:TRINITY_DN30441_c0_g1_i1.p1 TRINITY_DN30441_c0_g1~~TRINITY_DN30441_c0_g1_i1.p1  ORF type:complete len:1013 (+),score=146.76 TRINITY_DN30441_c0_g1_i1:203-3241(+)